MINLNDILGYKNMKIFQDSDLFSFSLDSIILANYSNIRFRDVKIVDFCTGNAVVPLILSKRYDKNIDAIEIQTNVFELAKKSVEYNKLCNKIKLYNNDVKYFCSLEENQNKYDFVLCNPPYFKNNSKSLKNIKSEKMIARHEIYITLNEICSCAKKILKDNGIFCMVHRTDRLMEIFKCLKDNNLEPKSIKFIYNDINSSSNIVLIHSQKRGKAGLKVDSPLILYETDGSMSLEYKNLINEVRK